MLILEEGQWLAYVTASHLALLDYLFPDSPFFIDTPKGAEASATIYTMVEMARAHGLNIYKYLMYLLDRLSDAKITDSALARQAPWDQDVKADITPKKQKITYRFISWTPAQERRKCIWN